MSGKEKEGLVNLKEFEATDTDGMIGKFERVLSTLQMLKHGRNLPDAFREIVLNDLDQVIDLLDQLKDLLNETEKNNKKIISQEGC